MNASKSVFVEEDREPVLEWNKVFEKPKKKKHVRKKQVLKKIEKVNVPKPTSKLKNYFNKMAKRIIQDVIDSISDEETETEFSCIFSAEEVKAQGASNFLAIEKHSNIQNLHKKRKDTLSRAESDMIVSIEDKPDVELKSSQSLSLST